MCKCISLISLIAIIEAILTNSMFISYIFVCKCLQVFVNAYQRIINLFWGALNFVESSSCVAG